MSFSPPFDMPKNRRKVWQFLSDMADQLSSERQAYWSKGEAVPPELGESLLEATTLRREIQAGVHDDRLPEMEARLAEAAKEFAGAPAEQPSPREYAEALHHYARSQPTPPPAQ